MPIFPSEKAKIKAALILGFLDSSMNTDTILDPLPLNELRDVALCFPPSSPVSKNIKERIEEKETKQWHDLHPPNPVNHQWHNETGRQVKKQKQPKKYKSNRKGEPSKIDESTWIPKEETFIFREAVAPGTTKNYKRNALKTEDYSYKFHIVWNGSKPKYLKIMSKQLDSLLNLFIRDKLKDSVASTQEINKYLDTEQPANRAVQDINDAFVQKIVRLFPTQKEHIPDLIFGYSNKRRGYISLIPIVPTDSESLTLLENEERPLEQPITEYLFGAGVIKRGGKGT